MIRKVELVLNQDNTINHANYPEGLSIAGGIFIISEWMAMMIKSLDQSERELLLATSTTQVRSILRAFDREAISQVLSDMQSDFENGSSFNPYAKEK